MHILHTVLCTFPLGADKKNLFNNEEPLWLVDHFIILINLLSDLGWHCKEKLDACHSYGSKGWVLILKMFMSNCYFMTIKSPNGLFDKKWAWTPEDRFIWQLQLLSVVIFVFALPITPKLFPNDGPLLVQPFNTLNTIIHKLKMRVRNKFNGSKQIGQSKWPKMRGWVKQSKLSVAVCFRKKWPSLTKG